MREENPSRIVWKLAGPAVALNSMQVVNTLLDRFFIGHLPAASLTALGGATNVMFLMFSLAMALATGSTAIVARAFGAENHGEYRTASRQAISLAIIAGAIIGAITVAIAPWVSNAMLPPEDREAIRLMSGFLVAYGLGLPAHYVIQAQAGALRGIGDTKSPMVISGFQILLHMLLNVLLIFPTRTIGGVTIPGANMGVVGAAAALSISAWIAALIYLAFSAKTPLGRTLMFTLPHADWVARILRIAVPAATMAVLRVLSLTVFTLVLKAVPNGSAAIAAMPVGFGIESIMFMPAFGLSVAASALVGQSLGAKNPERAERLGWIAGHHAALVTVALAVPIFFGAPWIASFLIEGKPDIIAETTTLIRYLCVTEIFFAYAMVMTGAMQGAGDTTRPLWISIGSLWGLRVPMAAILSLAPGAPFLGLAMPFGVGMGATGAWIAMAFTQGVQGIWSLIAFKQGAWKTREV